MANPSLLAAYNRYWEGMGSRSTPLYDFLSATFLIGKKDVELDWDKFELAFDGDPELNVYRNTTALPRAQIIHDARVTSGADAEAQAWSAVQGAGFDPAQQVVIEAGDAALPVVSPATDEETVRWLARTGNELTLEVTTSAPGYLVLSDVWYPGWTAETEIDGRVERQPVLRANSAFRAIPLWEAGTYEVQLHYAPAAWNAGLALLAVTLLVLIVVAAIAVIRRRRTKTDTI